MCLNTVSRYVLKECNHWIATINTQPEEYHNRSETIGDQPSEDSQKSSAIGEQPSEDNNHSTSPPTQS